MRTESASHWNRLRPGVFVANVFLDPEGRSQKATLVILVVVISSLKISKAFLTRSGVK